MSPPRGVWAVADRLAGPEDASAWADGAEAAQAWTFRRPVGGDGVALASLRTLRARAPWLAVHGRADLAAAAGADAVVAGFRSLPVAALARVATGLAIGASTHDPQERAIARETGAAFVVFGPIWETPSKAGLLAPRGLSALREACAEGLPVIAIGGVESAERVEACVEAGAHGVAVLRAARDAALLASLAVAWCDADAQPRRRGRSDSMSGPSSPATG